MFKAVTAFSLLLITRFVLLLGTLDVQSHPVAESRRRFAPKALVAAFCNDCPGIPRQWRLSWSSVLHVFFGAPFRRCIYIPRSFIIRCMRPLHACAIAKLSDQLR